MLKNKWWLWIPASALVLAFGLAGCWKSPTDPFFSGGGVSSNRQDTTTTDIDAAVSQVNSQGVFINVVDQNGDPINAANFTQNNFAITYNGAAVPSGSLTLATARGAGQSISTSLVLDYSGSMSGDIANLETAALAFVNNMQPADRGEVVKFDDTVVVVQAFTADKDALRHAISPTTGFGGLTAFWDATYRGIQDTAQQSGQRAVVAFTDGYENSSTVITSQAALIAEARSRGIPIYTVGLGAADTLGLQTIASQTFGRYYFAPTSAQLTTIYQQIAQIFSNTLIISWPSFVYIPGNTLTVTVTYVCATGTYVSSVTIVLP